MSRVGGESSEQPRRRQILRAENLMYDGYWNDDGLARHRVEPDHDPRTVLQYGSNIDYTHLEYDHEMEALLQQLPSRQLESVAETASRALWNRHISKCLHHGTMKIHKGSELEDEIIGTLDSNTVDVDELYGDLDSAVRTIPTTLTKKKNIKKRLSIEKKGLSRWMLMKYWFSTQWLKTKRWLIKETIVFDLWKSHLKIIEGCFGTSVVSYFIFLKWVLLINIPIFLLMFSFMVIPQILYGHYHKIKINRQDFTGIEILTGTGYFNDSEMYYGFYTNETVEVIKGNKYEMKYAYLLTCGGYYLFCLIILGYSFLRSYRKYYIESSGTFRQYLFCLTLCGWDYGITSHETVQLKHRSIYNEYKEYLAGLKNVIKEPTRREIRAKWCTRALVWIAVLALLCASGFVTFIVSTELSIRPSLANSTTNVASTLTMPFVISSMQLVIPVIFSFLETYEKFSMPKYELYVHMFREQLLRATMLGVLIYFWLNLSSSKVQCWENFVGQEIYRLTVMDMIFSVLYTFFMEFIRKLCSLKWKSIKRAEFAIAKNTLDLIYTQCLCWLGIFYSPLLPVVVILKLIITFYVKRYSLIQNCRPSLKPWRASSTHTNFIGYMFFFFIFSCIAAFFGIFDIPPSEICGPYRNYNKSYEVIEHLVVKWEKDYIVLGQIIRVINSPGFVTAVLILLCMAVYYTRAIMVSRRKRVEQFKLQLTLEGKDKQFLLNLLNHVRLRGIKAYDKPRPSIAVFMRSETSRDPQEFF